VSFWWSNNFVASLLFVCVFYKFFKETKHSQQQLEMEKSVNSDVEIGQPSVNSLFENWTYWFFNAVLYRKNWILRFFNSSIASRKECPSYSNQTLTIVSFFSLLMSSFHSLSLINNLHKNIVCLLTVESVLYIKHLYIFLQVLHFTFKCLIKCTPNLV
jgi:hypothetical protein